MSSKLLIDFSVFYYRPVSFYLLWVTACLFSSSLAADTIPVYEFENPSAERIVLDDYVRYRPEPSGRLTIGEVSAPQGPAFVSANHPRLQPISGVTWYRVEVSNPHAATVEKSVFISPEILEVWFHDSGAETFLVREYSGRFSTPSSGRGAATFHFFNMKLLPGKSVVYYLRTRAAPPPPQSGAVMVAIPYQDLWKDSTRTAVFQYFYLGIMVMFGLLSFFSFALFRKRVFLYFGAIMLIFGVYFIFLSSNHQALFGGDPPLGRHFWMVMMQVGLFINFFFFNVEYLGLRRDFPFYYRLFGGVTVALLIWGTYHNFVEMSDAPSVLLVLARLVWIFLSFYIIAKLAIRGLKAARVLATATALLFGGVVLNLLPVFNLLPHGTILSHSFQISTVFFAAIIFRELFVVFSELRRQKDKLKETDALKSHFFANITHEFRTPLTLMLGPLRQMIQNGNAPEDVDLLRVAELNAERQLELVDQLLELAQLDAKAMTLRAAETDFSRYLRQLCGSYESLSEHRKISLKLSLPEEAVTAWIDTERMNRVFFNLLSNAFKFTPEGGEIQVALARDAGKVSVIVADTGRGIAPELLPHVFDRFFLGHTGSSDAKGSGIGLALVREMVSLHYGKVGVSSKLGAGTTFTIELPLGKEHLQPDEIANPVTAVSSTAHVTQVRLEDFSAEAEAAAATPVTQNADRSNVLLIEDNVEMRAFIRQMLVADYNVFTAADGAEGVRMAVEDPPDLIISDLMMPRKDGYAVCRELKADLRTSHVPIILLTARAARKDRLAGLDEGADDYLTKPFDGRELLVRAANLIRSRRRLRESFAVAITVKPSEIAVSSLDQKLLADALAHVEAHIDDAQLSVDHLASGLGLSRTQLNRKMRALVDQSSNQFIQSVRLQRAAQLLTAKGGTVKEIAYACGFSSPGYFARAFKAAYGVSPGKYSQTILT